MSGEGDATGIGEYGGDSGTPPGGRDFESRRRRSGQTEWEEYDAGEWDDREGGDGTSALDGPSTRKNKNRETKPQPPEPVKEVNFFDLDDEGPAPPAPLPKASLDGQ
jgi:epsin